MRLLDEGSVGVTEEIEQIVLMHQMRLRAYLYSRVGNEDIADDLAQEVFLVFIKRFGEFDRSQPVWPWLLGIARNKLWEHWRAREREDSSHAIELLLANEQIRRDSQAGALAYDARRLEALKGCLSKLSRKSRQLLRLAYAERLGGAEIAERWNASEGAVRTALYRIRMSLSSCIKTAMGEGKR